MSVTPKHLLDGLSIEEKRTLLAELLHRKAAERKRDEAYLLAAQADA